MTTRLVLNLVHAANPQEDYIYRSRTGINFPEFNSSGILGNIGAPVRVSSEDVEEFREDRNDDSDENLSSDRVNQRSTGSASEEEVKAEESQTDSNRPNKKDGENILNVLA